MAVKGNGIGMSLNAMEAAREEATEERMTWVEGRGGTRRVRSLTQRQWWSRLLDKIRALATWATNIEKGRWDWYVKSRGVRKEGPEMRKRPSEGRKAKKLSTSNGTREGTRLWWWIEGGVGSDATGPMSVREGRRASGPPSQ